MRQGADLDARDTDDDCNRSREKRPAGNLQRLRFL